jgi:starch synthase
MNRPREIWIVLRELLGIAFSGGVGVVGAQKAKALARAGIRVVLVMPYYTRAKADGLDVQDTGIELDLPMDYSPVTKRRTRAKVYKVDGWAPGCTVYLIQAPCFEKEGIYTYTQGEAERCGDRGLVAQGHQDFFEMNVTLEKAALELIIRLEARPDIVECHDAHTALIPAMMRIIPRYRGYFRGVATGIIVHNAGRAYNQQVFDVRFARAITELPDAVLETAHHRGGVYPFVVGGMYASWVSTVSDKYADEIMNDPIEDERTDGIGTAFRERGIHLIGITNGVDPEDYQPTDPMRMKIAAAYNPARDNLAGKRECRVALIREIGANSTRNVRFVGHLVDAPGRAMVATISRLSTMKGIDRCVAGVRRLLRGPDARDALFIALGTGESEYEDELSGLAAEFEGRVAVAFGHDVGLANRVFAGADLFVNAAEFAPCETTDFNAILMGTAPVVHHVGGLTKVNNKVNGYAYYYHTGEALAEALRTAVDTLVRRPDDHVRLIRQGIQLIYDWYTWDKVIERGYMPIYEQAMEHSASPGENGAPGLPECSSGGLTAREAEA